MADLDRDQTVATKSAQENAGKPELHDEPAMLYCPVCSERLLSSRCKLVCQRCGYFMSCADYY